MKEKSELYPLKFHPIFKQKIWGGNKIPNFLGKGSGNALGESWELSAVEGDISIVENGDLQGIPIIKLIEKYAGNLLGEKVYSKFGTKFPLLFKFIDAHEDLSVQLHPNDTLAKERHNSFGKTEMWYVLQADINAKLVLGFKENTSKEKYIKAVNDNQIMEMLHLENVKAGDAFYISPGKVHAIGAGVLLAEIQQTSDITYRIFDYNRPDVDGSMRQLHTELALDAINFKAKEFNLDYTEDKNSETLICKSDYFITNKLVLDKDFMKTSTALDSFIVYMCVSGKATIVTENYSEELKMGETILIPACINQFNIKTTSATLLEVYIP